MSVVLKGAGGVGEHASCLRESAVVSGVQLRESV